MDRKKVLKGDLHHDFILENIIGDHKVSCTHQIRGGSNNTDHCEYEDCSVEGEDYERCVQFFIRFY